MANVNMTRAIKSLEWKNEVFMHKYGVKSLLARSLNERVNSLEELVEHLQDAFNNICVLLGKVNGETNPKKGSAAMDLSFSKAKVVKPAHFQRSPSLKAGSHTNFGQLLEQLDKSVVHNSQNSFQDAEGADLSAFCFRIKNYETNLHLQKSYNSQLKSTLNAVQQEAKKAKKLTEKLERQTALEHEAEREQWKQYIESYRSLTELELEKKQRQIIKMNEILSAWIDRFVQLQQERGTHRRAASGDSFPDMKNLCKITSEVILASKDVTSSISGNSAQSPVWSGKSTNSRSGRASPGPTELD